MQVSPFVAPRDATERMSSPPERGTRVVAHVHSDWSYDGSWSLERLAQAFKRRGYRAILTAEHDRGFDEAKWQAYKQACAAASDESMLLVPGIEYSDSDNTIHVPVWGSLPFLGESLETEAMLSAVHDAGGIAVFAHPRRKHAMSRFDPSWFRYLTGIELWNRRYDGWAPNRDVAVLLRSRRELLPFATLDFHTSRHFHPLAMVLDIDDVNEESILEAFRARKARPTAFRTPAETFAQAPTFQAMRVADETRRTGIKLARRARASARKRPRD